MITVLLVDDHALVRRGFRRLLEDESDIAVVGEAGDGREAVRLTVELQPHVVVMDYAMPVLDGVAATREIRRRVTDTAVLMLSMHADEQYRRNAIEAGACGYLLKNAVDVDLAAAIREVAATGEVKSADAGPAAAEPPGFNALTAREKQVLQLVAQGKSNRDIAELLGLSPNTVAVHRNSLMHKLKVHRTAELVLYAMRHGLISPA